jgi:hypothetical protein
MSTDLENLTVSFGLAHREFRDVHAVVSRLDHQVRRLVEPAARPSGDCDPAHKSHPAAISPTNTTPAAAIQ